MVQQLCLPMWVVWWTCITKRKKNDFIIFLLLTLLSIKAINQKICLLKHLTDEEKILELGKDNSAFVAEPIQGVAGNNTSKWLL